MKITELLINELDHEAIGSRKALERVRSFDTGRVVASFLCVKRRGTE